MSKTQIPPVKGLIKTILPKTLFGRSLLILITPILLIQIVATFMFFDRHWSKMTSRLAYAISGEIAMIADEIERNPDPANIQALSNQVAKNLSLLISFTPGANNIAFDREPGNYGWESMIDQTLSHELQSQLRYPFALNVDFREKWVELRVQLSHGVLNISLPQRRLFTSTSYIFLIWVFSVSFILLVISILFMRNQIRPIRRLALAAERFGKGRDVSNFKLEGAKEVRQAGQAFLDMRTRIQRQISQRTTMLAGVSHDLRTPLTRLKLQLAMLGNSPDIEAMKNDIQDMEKMIDGYLNFVRGEGEETPTKTDLTAMLEKIAADAKRQGCNTTLNTNNLSITMDLRPMAIERCLGNLIGNAAKYADHVWIELQKTHPDKITISIKDNGPGIPESQYEDVFKPFYRVDSSRNTATGGVGLGLPIAMDIVHAHGGKIWLEKSTHGGLAVKISLPL